MPELSGFAKNLATCLPLCAILWQKPTNEIGRAHV